MDLVIVAAVATLIVAGATAGQHFYDRFHPRGLYRATITRAESNAKAIRDAVLGLEGKFDFKELRDELRAIPESIGERIGSAIGSFRESVPSIDLSPVVGKLDALIAELQATSKAALSAAMAAKGSVGGTAKAEAGKEKEVLAAIGHDFLGGAMGEALKFALPSLYEWLIENPSLVLEVAEWPRVKPILEKVRGMVGKVTGAEGGGGHAHEISWRPPF
jgi:hypothetical protein